MQLRHLRYFVKIVEAGSFSRAATTIHVAQPALSQQIAELEERLGVPVLQRHARGVRPTPGPARSSIARRSSS
ncbi:MAG: LysR family transcriptional regulator [Hyphomicrobium sp.]